MYKFVSSKKMGRLEEKLATSDADLQTQKLAFDRQSDELEQLHLEHSQLQQNADFYKTILGRVIDTTSPLTQIRSSLATTAEQTDQFLKAYDAETRDGVALLKRFQAELLSTKEETVSAGEQVNTLKMNAEDIARFIVTIDTVSEQTNLLALNAAIEAARAGEHGRGFAVVADEVRALAKTAGESAQQIKGVVEEISHNTTRCDNSMGQIQSQFEMLSDQVVELVDIITNLINNSEALYLTIRKSYNLIFLRLVALDHVSWKLDVYDRIRNHNTDSSQIVDHHHCRLGQWYYQGLGQEQFSSSSIFKRIEKPHEQVHCAGKQAIDALSDGDLNAVYACLEQMEAAASRVIDELENLSQEVTES